MQSGRLNEVIAIERPIISLNEYGANSIVWERLFVTRADVLFESGNRALETGEIVFNYSKVFVIRYYHSVDEKDRVIWKDKKYRILSLEPDRDRQLLTIRTELIND